MRLRLLIGGLVLIALVSGLELFLSQGGFSKPVHTLFTERSREALGEPVSVEKIRLSMFPPSAIAYGVVLPTTPDGLAGGTIRKLRIRISPWSLITGGVRALDIAVYSPDVTFSTALIRPEEGGTAFTWDPARWGSHRLSVKDARLTIRHGEDVFQALHVKLDAAPSVTLRQMAVDIATGQVTLNNEEVLSATSIELDLLPDRVRVRESVIDGVTGSLQARGDVRISGGKAPELGLTTTFNGTAAGARKLARRFDIVLPPFTGQVGATGRLYGTPDAPHWDGEVRVTGLELDQEPRRVEEVTARLRVQRGQAEVVHSRIAAGGGELRATGTLTLGEVLAYDARVRADDVALSWLLQEETPLGVVGGEARLVGTLWKWPRGRVEWRYRDDHPREDDPQGAAAPPWRRVLVKLSRGQGIAHLSEDGVHRHEFSLETPDTRVSGQATVDADLAVNGNLSARSDQFNEIGRMIDLPFVFGRAEATARVSGTWPDLKIAGRGGLADGRIGDLRVDRLTGEIIASAGRLIYRNVEIVGDGRISLDGELRPPPKDQPDSNRFDDIVLDVRHVPLKPLVALFLKEGEEVPELDFPVSGKLHVVRSPERVMAWVDVLAGEGRLYGQRIMDGRARMWIDQDHLKLSRLQLGIPAGGRRAVATGEGTLRWEDGSFEATLSSEGLPIQSVDYLAESIPFFTGNFAGNAILTGNYDAPRLRSSGVIRNLGFYGMSVGAAELDTDLFAWQLMVRATLYPNETAGGEPDAHVVYYGHIEDEGPFNVAARFGDRDAVPWVRGLLPEMDETNREELGEDYTLRAEGRIASYGTIKDGSDWLRFSVLGGSFTMGKLEARLVSPTRIDYHDETTWFHGMHIAGEGLDFVTTGSMKPDISYDLGVAGRIEWPWMQQYKPIYRVSAGHGEFDVRLTGEWDVPWVTGTFDTVGIVTTPEELDAAQMTFTMTGPLEMDGPLEDPPLGNTRAHFTPLLVDIFGYRLGIDDVVLVGRDANFSFPGVELSGDVGQVRLEGDFRYPTWSDLRAVGTLRLSELFRKLDGFDQGGGDLDITWDMSGDWEDPRVRFGATTQEGQVRVVALDQILQVNDLNVINDGKRTVVDSLEGRIGGGTLSAQGTFNDDGSGIRMIVALDGYAMRPFTGFTGTITGELMLAGALPAPTLSGDLHIKKGRYDRRMQWGAWIMDAVAAGQEELNQVVPYGETKLNLRISGDEEILVDNNLAKMSVDLDLNVGGTLTAPTLEGQMDSREGEIYFREHVFEVDHASAVFTHGDQIVPHLDMLARTTIEHTLPDDPLRSEPVDVVLSLSGTPERFDLLLTSRPDLPQEDIMSLILFGHTVEELAEEGGVGTSESIYVVTGQIQSELEEQAHNLIGLDTFQIMPTYIEGEESINTARIVVGKKLFDGQGRVIYSTAVGADEEPVIQFSYRISPKLSILIEQDKEGQAGGEFRFRVRFR